MSLWILNITFCQNQSFLGPVLSRNFWDHLNWVEWDNYMQISKALLRFRFPAQILLGSLNMGPFKLVVLFS